MRGAGSRALLLAALLALAACGVAAPPESPPEIPGGPDLTDFWSG